MTSSEPPSLRENTAATDIELGNHEGPIRLIQEYMQEEIKGAIRAAEPSGRALRAAWRKLSRVVARPALHR